MIIRSGDDEFDWSLETDIPVPPQLATTVYSNARGEIVVRQRDDGFEDGDTIVILTVANADAIGHALIELAEESGFRPAWRDTSIPTTDEELAAAASEEEPDRKTKRAGNNPGPLLQAMEEAAE
jgi:hypothetical protein